MVAFIIWCSAACIFIAFGIYCLFAKSVVGFWANTGNKPEVSDIKKYNKAMCILWCVFGLVMIALGVPLLAGDNSPFILITILGTPIEIIVTMVIYVTVIEKKYRSGK